jgi:AcrR family transcriptional regulator
MAIVIEHDKRRKQILEKALLVFMDDGFENATFQRIADSCGITRTTLYLYFKNKKEIFNYSIKQLLFTTEESINKIQFDKSLGSMDKITKVLFIILRMLEQNKKLLLVILEYLMHLSKSEGNVEMRVRRRMVRLRHILSYLVIEGIKSGELKKGKIKLINDYLYNFIEAAVFHQIVLNDKNFSDYKDTVAFAVKQLAV